MSDNTNSKLFKEFHKQYEHVDFVDELLKHLHQGLRYLNIRQTHCMDFPMDKEMYTFLIDLIEEKYGNER
jgi:hypothetical protein